MLVLHSGAVSRLAERSLVAVARIGSAVDALVVAFAEPGGAVLTSDAHNLLALATHAQDVVVERV